MAFASLKSLAEILVGYQSRTRIDPNPAGTHKLVQGRDFPSKEELRTDCLLTFTPDHAPEPYMLQTGDILFQARGNEHFAFCVQNPPPNTLASGSFYIIRPRLDNLSPHYLAWWINQSPAQRYLQSASQASNIPFVSKTVFSNLEVQIPDLQTQETIHRVNDLMRREQVLCEQITKRRAQYIEMICLNRIQKQGER